LTVWPVLEAGSVLVIGIAATGAEPEELSTEIRPVAIATMPMATATMPPKRADPKELRKKILARVMPRHDRRRPSATAERLLNGR
jgi:hypothetical protein